MKVKVFPSHQLSSLQKLDHAISKFQEFAGLSVTGQLNQETVEMMKTPRCGVKDFIDEDEDADTPRIKVRGVLSRKKVCLLIFFMSSSHVAYRDTCCKDQDGE